MLKSITKASAVFEWCCPRWEFYFQQSSPRQWHATSSTFASLDSASLAKIRFQSTLQRWMWRTWCWFSTVSLPSVWNCDRNPQNESEWAQITIICSMQQWIEPGEKLFHQVWLPGWVLQRRAHYTALSAPLGSCYAPSFRPLSLPTSRITTDWENPCLIHLAELLSPGNTKQHFAFVPQFLVCKAINNHITEVCSELTC